MCFFYVSCVYVDSTRDRRNLFFLGAPAPVAPFSRTATSKLHVLGLFLPLFPPTARDVLTIFVGFVRLRGILRRRTPIDCSTLSTYSFSSKQKVRGLFRSGTSSVFSRLSPCLASRRGRLFSAFGGVGRVVSVTSVFARFFSSTPPSSRRPRSAVGGGSPGKSLGGKGLSRPSYGRGSQSTRTKASRSDHRASREGVQG